MITVELHGFEAEVEDDGRLGPLQDPVRNNRMPTAAELRDYAEFIRLVAGIMVSYPSFLAGTKGSPIEEDSGA